jgi:predicted glycosyltransferase
VAFSHGSYAQIVAARLAGVPAVTMMDYEHQPANHLSFRLARIVLVPEIFPGRELQLEGAGRKAWRYAGFKEELYLADLSPDPGVLDELGVDPARVIATFRPPPEGALYHRAGNRRFDELVGEALAADAQVVLLARSAEQAARYRARGAIVPARAVDASSLLALSDLTVGAGGTMTRESALLGTPTYTVFAGELAAADRALIEDGRLVDLRDPSTRPAFQKRSSAPSPPERERADAIGERVVSAIYAAARRATTSSSNAR